MKLTHSRMGFWAFLQDNCTNTHTQSINSICHITQWVVRQRENSHTHTVIHLDIYPVEAPNNHTDIENTQRVYNKFSNNFMAAYK